jgi:hypothetical protein
VQAFLKLKNQSAELYRLSQLIIKVIIINQLIKYTNGTTNKTIGCASMNFKDHFEQQDFVELLIHQLTHMLLFIDDRCYQHIHPANKETMIETDLPYVLGGNHFPIHLAFHSYVVGVEVLCFRAHAIGLNYSSHCHGTTIRIIKTCQSFQDSLLKNEHLFLERGQSILHDASLLLRHYY